MKTYDYTIIGSGPSVDRFLVGMQGSKKRILVVESDNFGGICPNAGCEPKIFLEGAIKTALTSRDLLNKGIESPAKLNWNDLILEKKRVFSPVSTNNQHAYEELGADTVRGTASFVDEHTIKVDETLITSDNFIIATGLKPRPMNIPGSHLFLTSDDFFNMEDLPATVAIIGSGYVGMEIATILSAAGSNVTMLQRSDRPLRDFDSRHVDMLIKNMKENLGIDFRFNTQVTKAEKTSNGILVTTDNGQNLEFSTVINATGRIPNINALNLENTKVDFDKDGVIVDKYLRTTASNIYAIGDVIKKDIPRLTLTAQFEGAYLSAYLLGKKKSEIHYPVIGKVTFTFPQLASTGVDIDQARLDPNLTVKDIDISKGDFLYAGTNDYNAHLSLVYDQNQRIIAASEISQTASDDINIFIPIIALDIDQNLWNEKMVMSFPSLAFKLRNIL